MAALQQAPERFGPYLLLSHLGRGGMADVYKARVEGVAGFSRNVVVKRILKVHTEEPHFVEMFINEAKIASRLSHPNVVQVYELGEVDGELFMAMEYVRGRDLLRIMRAAAAHGEPAPPQQVGAYIVREVARGLAHAHDHVDEAGAPRPIIHRDVSPQNIMISYDGQVKLVDFGIAKAVTAFHEVTQTGSLKGKFGYMAPEQIVSGRCTPQTDIFSAGVVLHEVLTGRRLFKGQTDYDTMTKVQTGPLLPPSSLNPQIDPDLDRIVLCALERDTSRRYQKAAHLARDLDAYLQKARFTSEDIVVWLRRVVPPAEREDLAESQALPTQSPGPATGRSRRLPSLPLNGESLGDLAGVSVSHLTPGTPSSRSAHTPLQPQAAGRRRALLYGLMALAFLLSLGSVLLIIRPRPAPPARPAPQPKPPAPPVPPAQNSQPAAAPARVLLDSKPSGAKVYAGGEPLGVTPLMVEIRGDALEVVLRYRDRIDLTHTLARADDGKEVVLTLSRARRGDRHRSREAPGDLPPGPPERPPEPVRPPERPPEPQKGRIRVKIVDEDEPRGRIKSVDD